MLANYTIDGFENIQYQGFGKLKYIENVLTGLYARFGYCQVETPTFEAYDFYSGEEGMDPDELFKLVSSTGKVLALKPDATLPIARMAAINHHDPDEIVKFSYLTNIYRNFSAPEIQKKETTQAGVEYFGNHTPECDGEIIALAILSLRLCGVDDIHIDVGHVGFINALLDELDLGADERRKLFTYIENKNLADIREFVRDREIPEEKKRVIRRLPRLYGEPQKVFSEMRSLSLNDGMAAAADELSQIIDHLRDLGLSDCVAIDLGFTNSMNYYSGMILKGYIENYGESVINGGRYDEMSRKFGIDRPACGFGVDLVRLMDYLEKSDRIREQEHAKSVVLYAPEEKMTAFRFLQEKRRSGSGEMFTLSGREADEFVRTLQKNPHYRNADIYHMDRGIRFYEDGAFIEASPKHQRLYEKSREVPDGQ